MAEETGASTDVRKRVDGAGPGSPSQELGLLL